MSGLLVGIDLGSQSAKVVVYDEQGDVLATGRRPLAVPDRPRPGIVEHPGDDLWDALGSACRDAMAGLGGRRAELVGVGLCGIRFCRALLHADGTLAAPVQSWMDERVSRPYEPERTDVEKVTASSGYLTARLTGEVRDSVAAYQGQWPIDTAGWAWSVSDEDVGAFGLRRSQLADLVLPGELLGRVTDAAAEATGLPSGLPVVATANDKAVEALGCDLRDPGRLLLSLGTYVAAMTVGHRPTPGAAFWTNFASEPGRYLFESTGIRRGMWTVSWLGRLLAADEDALEQEAMRVPPGSDGLSAVLDWLAPPDEPWRRGAFVGLDARHGAGHLHRAVLEGIALTMQRHAAAMTAELGTTPDGLIVSGGGARSPLMRRILADVFAVPVTQHGGPSAAARGAAICAAVGVGLHPSWEAACAALVPAGETVHPEPEGVAAYAAVGRTHRTVARGIDDLLAQTTETTADQTIDRDAELS